ncbi:unnamed protein product [Durusdinium trenchii]|uniref:Uncharacterized protein n=1 Tax=Durusdinium trenchii TaxID=1381693 RepID=A0ABP0IZ48_9DINO
MRDVLVATGASVPGGEAYDEVMKELNKRPGGSATVWFDTVPVWGFEGGLQANGHKWRHPSHDCGRDDVPVPPPEGRHPMWEAEVESRISRKAPAVGSKHPCHLVGVPNSIRIFMDFLFVLIPSAESFSTTKWSAALVWLDTHVNVVCQGWCCHWLRKVKQKQAEGAVICCAVSNIYARDWVDMYGAGSSELSDSLAKQYGLPPERFKNGRPPGWGEGEIEISNGNIFSRVAPEHPHTKMPLGAGCRWEREALDNLGCTVMAFFMP